MGIFDGIIGGALGAAGSIWNNERNIAFQRETNEHNEALMREAWGREDSAVQRRAADMEAAGFNPVLATGAAASTMPAVRAEAPEARENVGRSAVEGYRNAVDISLTEAQAEKIRQDARVSKAEADMKERVITDEYGHQYTWSGLTLSKMYEDAIRGRIENKVSQMGLDMGATESRVAANKVESDFVRDHGRELQDLALTMKREGASQEAIKTRLLKLTEEYLPKDKIFQYISSITGSFARVAGSAPLW